MTRTSNTLVARLAQEMSERWGRGERPTVEDFLERDATLRQRDFILELIYEEHCLRSVHGDVAAGHYVERFPEYREEIEILLGCHELLESPAATAPAASLAVGDTLGPFRLLAELGRGALGRVFLARQAALADRPVVLKITPRAGREHVSLARLQHTHIVPLYAAHDDAARRLRVLCMPYFGNATLARVLDALRGCPVRDRTGQDLIAAVDSLQADTPDPLPARGPAREVLVQASYADAICRIGACLADALHYAHQRALVHLDLKPSNILLAVDGQPMLLDFHLAQAPLPAAALAPDWLGGTQAYMPPEQQAALAAASLGQPVPAAVDGRADLYALGVVLYEALTGRLPTEAAPPAVHRLNPRVALGLSDIVRRCLATLPEHRYRDGAALAADLHRHVCDQPLCGVSNRSALERWRKWRRRRPHQLMLLTMFLAVVAAAAAVGITHWDRWSAQLDQAGAALSDGRAQQQQGRLDEAAASFQRGLALVEGQPLPSELAMELRARLRDVALAQQEAGSAQFAREFQRLADALRFLHGADWQIVASGSGLAERCAALWRKRAELLDRLGPGVKTDLLDIVLLWTDVRLRLAGPAQQDEVRSEALVVLGEAEMLLGPSHVLYRHMELLATGLGRTDEASAAAAKAVAHPPRSAWEHYVTGRQILLSATGPDANATLLRAAAELEEALRLQPHGVWPNYFFGQCAYRTGRYEEAIRSFSTCIGAAPAAAEWFACRALAYAALGQAEPALRDHAHARTLEPAAVCPLAAVHYNLAAAHSGKGDLRAARQHLDLALRDDPGHVASRALLQRLRGN